MKISLVGLEPKTTGSRYEGKDKAGNRQGSRYSRSQLHPEAVVKEEVGPRFHKRISTADVTVPSCCRIPAPRWKDAGSRNCRWGRVRQEGVVKVFLPTRLYAGLTSGTFRRHRRTDPRNGVSPRGSAECPSVSSRPGLTTEGAAALLASITAERPTAKPLRLSSPIGRQTGGVQHERVDAQ